MSPQSQSLYQKLLISRQAMSANELGDALHICPSSVYRLARPLLEIGLIKELVQYPSKFEAKPLNEGLSMFLLAQNDWFLKQFSQAPYEEKSNSTPKLQQIQFSFIQSREELMKVSVGETNRANKSIDLLRSGHEIPADLMLAIKESQKRKVLTRMLIQDYSPENAQEVSSWKRNGILVRKTSLSHIRLMTYDGKIVYFMSYKHTDSEKDMGMKIEYPPFAIVLSQLFDLWWKAAEKI